MADTARIAEALALVRAGRGFEAHEEFEELWRAAAPAERDRPKRRTGTTLLRWNQLDRTPI